MPTFMSDTAQPLLTGITTQAMQASMNVSIGASRNSTRLAPAGITVSLVKTLTASAKG